jgi:hypothetical protein
MEDEPACVGEGGRVSVSDIVLPHPEDSPEGGFHSMHSLCGIIGSCRNLLTLTLYMPIDSAAWAQSATIPHSCQEKDKIQDGEQLEEKGEGHTSTRDWPRRRLVHLPFDALALRHHRIVSEPPHPHSLHANRLGAGWVIIAQQRYRTVVRRRTKSKTESSSRRRGRDTRRISARSGKRKGWTSDGSSARNRQCGPSVR